MLLLLKMGGEMLGLLEIHYYMILEYLRATSDIQHGKQMATKNGHR